MNITRGKKNTAKKVVVYGPEGIGKSTFASCFPDPVFIDTEGSTNDMDVARFDKATSWEMLLEQVRYVVKNPSVCKTLVIDTADWAEQMCMKNLCDSHNKKGIEDFGYGNGYVYAKEEWGKFLNLLQEVVEKGVHVVVTAHSHIRKFEQPDELGAYDRYELKLGKKTQSQTSPLLKEWADMVLFANYKIMSVAADKDGRKHKAQGGRRVMYTSHHPCWDAKNRYGLPEELPFDYSEIAHIISGTQPETQKEQPTAQPAIHKPQQEPVRPEPAPAPAGEQMSLPLDAKPEKPFPAQDPGIPKALRDLMETNHVDEWELQNVVAARGYFPDDMPVRDYPEDFINGVLIGAWGQVFAMIENMRKTQEVPFNH